jgi:hypothetical protein
MARSTEPVQKSRGQVSSRPVGAKSVGFHVAKRMPINAHNGRNHAIGRGHRPPLSANFRRGGPSSQTPDLEAAKQKLAARIV